MTLRGKVLISTVYSNKSAEIRKIFEPLGATVVDFPMTEIKTADLTSSIVSALMNIEDYDWIIFTSSNGIHHLLKLLELAGKGTNIPARIRIAAVGIKTTAELEKHGIKVSFTGSGTAENLITDLLKNEKLEGSKILLPLGNLAPATIQSKLSGIAKVTRINVYNTTRAEIAGDEPVELIRNGDYSMILFTSPSGVANFTERIGSIDRSFLRAASIGNVTTNAARQLGINCLVTAPRSTYADLADEIVKYYKI